MFTYKNGGGVAAILHWNNIVGIFLILAVAAVKAQAQTDIALKR